MILPAPTSNLDMVVCAGPDGAESSRSEPPITIIGAVRGTRRIVILLIDECVKRTWPAVTYVVLPEVTHIVFDRD